MERFERSAATVFVIMAVIVLSCFSFSVHPVRAADEPKKAEEKKTYTPNEVQTLKLENAQLTALNAQLTYNNRAQQLPEFQQFQQTYNAILRVCDAIRAENKWPDTVRCDPNQRPIVFNDTAAPPPPTPAPATAPATAPVKK